MLGEGAKARMVASECGNVLKSTVSLRDCITWNQVTAKYGEVMMRKMKDMFKPREGRDEVIFHGYCLLAIPEDWRWLLEYFATPQFKRDLITGELAPPDVVWEMQHARTKQGVLVWSDPQSQEIHGCIQQLVNEQTEVPAEEPRMKLNQTKVDSRVSSVIETACVEREEDRVQMRTEMLAKREEDRVQMRAKIRAEMDNEIDRRIKAQLGALRASLQQGQFQTSGSNSAENSPVGAQSK
ncbi:uncharacterized protein G2W53_035086 [Senna tora]|uniref:Uncharacterized protein n=1 Tax=Senna tora TaxID=362788 RepID=A0A834SPH9_9FABA|nr:uncharacterized protein G2W53_035086 [Senna tora]